MSDKISISQAIEEALKKLDKEGKAELLRMLQEKEDLKKYNKLNYFKAYDFQKQFYGASKDFRFRFLCAANRVGKSYSESFEMACHLTGRYPTWWTGHRFEKPILAWAVGITGDSTRKVLQKELFGTSVAKDLGALGTGAIPRDCIDFDTIEKDGNKILIVQIKHHNARGEFDGMSTLEFRSTQQGEHALMGATVDFIWLDEEDPYDSMNIFSQCVTRTLTTKGLVVLTATPENGRTELVDKFMVNKEGDLYWQNATWWDAPHITEKDIKDMLAAIPDWQVQMRSRGEPVMGSGLIYDVSDEQIRCESFPIPDHWRRIAGVDIGITHDTAVVWSAYDPDGDVVYIYDAYHADGGVPALHAHAINARGNWIPVVLPHDSQNMERGSGMSVAQYYINAGVNAKHETFYNKIGMDGKKNNFVEPGIMEIRERMKTGRFKVFNHCHRVFEEKARYHRTEGKIVKTFDDTMDAMRYSAMSVTHRGVSKNDANHGYTSAYNDNISRWNSSY